MSRKTFKYRLYPTRQQRERLQKTLDVCRELYNAALHYLVRDHHGQMGCRSRKAARLTHAKHDQVRLRLRCNVQDRFGNLAALNHIFRNAPEFRFRRHEIVQDLRERSG